MIFHHDPLTTADDRAILKWFWIGVAAVICLIALQGMARAESEADGGPMSYASRMAGNIKGKAIGGVNKTVARAKNAQVRLSSRNSVSLSGIVSPLAAKAREIMDGCGSKVVSAVRVGATVFGGSYSNHARGRAVDLQGNPSCIYAHLKGWPGGYSTDYWIAPGGPHVHVSYNPNGMEWGLRFVHRKPKRTSAALKREGA